jgi:hypothetical protein
VTGLTWTGPGAPRHERPPARLVRLGARLTRARRWEFWPAWAVYGLLTPRLLRLALRHRSVTVFTAANPAMPLGGFVGESKWAILRALPREVAMPTVFVEPTDDPAARLATLQAALRAEGWAWPVVLKPDVGERGSGVALVRTGDEALDYFRQHPRPAIAQPYHPGPHEVGVFYVRPPGMAKGRIFSITVKRHPRALGDGASTLAGLIWRDPRLRLQADTLIAGLGEQARRVPAAGESVLLTIAGNHCRGTMFLDGAGLITPALTAAFDAIADAYPGFCFGRFDVRYADPAAFARGEGFRIVELNGVLSESTNIYDPGFSLRRGLAVLAEQWSLAFAIGAANARAGARVASVREIVAAVRSHRSATATR